MQYQEPPNYDQEKLKYMLGEAWTERDTEFDNYIHSGWNLSAYVGTYERVLHVQCADNPFKYIIPHVTGIDTREEYRGKASYIMSIEEYYVAYKYRRANVAFCLESFDHETKESLERKLWFLTRMMKPQDSRIFFRNKVIIPQEEIGENTDEPIENPIDSEEQEIPEESTLYPWTVDEHMRLAEMFGYEVVDVQEEINDTMYVMWVQKNRSYGEV